jgi:hypothetical protein
VQVNASQRILLVVVLVLVLDEFRGRKQGRKHCHGELDSGSRFAWLE